MKRYPSFWSIVVISLLLINLCSCQKNDSTEISQGQIELTSNELQPDNYFQDATDAFVNGDYTASADAIHLGIDAMEQILTQADATQKVNIENSMKDLRELSEKVAIDQLDGVQELNYFFAKAGEALAGLHMHISKTEYINLSGKEAGANLERAIAEIEQTIKYHGRSLSSEETLWIDQLRKDALRLREGETISQAEMETIFKKLNYHIQQLDDELEVKYIDLKTTKRTIIHDKP